MEEEKLFIACQANRVCPSLSSVFLARNWLSSEEEEAQLLQQTTGAACRWTQLKGRRVQTLGGLVTEQGLLAAPLPRWLQSLFARILRESGPLFTSALDGAALNYCLVNAYSPGEGILAHQDGPLYRPAVAIVSLGADTEFRFTPHASLLLEKGEELAEQRVLLPRRSCLLFFGDAYTRWLHGTVGLSDGSPVGCSDRISLTCRSVVRVRKLL
jgi:alkylated DNA repair protein alkB family protein 6